MSPHAISAGSSPAPSVNNSVSYSLNGSLNSEVDQSPYLQPVPASELHDLICIGFGPASLAIAVALHDSFEEADDGLNGIDLPKVAFLEMQERFAWHAGMQIHGAKMQISFLKDLATQRNPRSHFTFINYLHQKQRLNQYANLGTFLPRRIEYEDYMRWAAGHFSDVVQYGQTVTSVKPEIINGKETKDFVVESRNVKTGQVTARRTKHVVIAVGGRPKIPDSLPQNSPRVIHSSRYQRFLADTNLDFQAPLRIAVLGGGQSAAEIFSDVATRFPNSTSFLMIKDSALRPSDDSPFVNEVFDPERVDGIFATEPARRRQAIVSNRATNYGVVRLELLEHLYEELYTQRILHGNDEAAWPRRILHNRLVVSATEESKGGLRLVVRDTEHERPADDMRVDLLFVAAGYERNMHEDILAGCRPLLPEGKSSFEVQRDYSVLFDERKVPPAADVGVWLQGCNESTHGLSDSLLSILAVRGGEIVSSVFGR